jgi:hypothetical protein
MCCLLLIGAGTGADAGTGGCAGTTPRAPNTPAALPNGAVTEQSFRRWLATVAHLCDSTAWRNTPLPSPRLARGAARRPPAQRTANAS